MYLSTMNTTTLLEPIAQFTNGDILHMSAQEWKTTVQHLRAFLEIVYAFGMIFMAFSVPVNMLYQSIQKPTISSVLSLMRSGAITIPMLLILVPMIGITGVQIAQPTADVISGLISIPFIIHFLRKDHNV